MSLRSQVERAAARALLGLPRPLLRRFAGPPVRSPEGYELDLQGQAQLRLMRISKQPELHERGVEAGRRNLDRVGPLLEIRGIDDVDAIDRTVPGADGPRRARVYTPRARARTRARARLVSRRRLGAGIDRVARRRVPRAREPLRGSSSSRSTTGSPPSTSSPQESTTRSPRPAGCRATPHRSASTRPPSPSAATARAETSPPSSRSSCAALRSSSRSSSSSIRRRT